MKQVYIMPGVLHYEKYYLNKTYHSSRGSGRLGQMGRSCIHPFLGYFQCSIHGMLVYPHMLILHPIGKVLIDVGCWHRLTQS